MRLGRLPHNPALLASAPAHRFGAAMPPAELDRTLIDFVPADYGNQTDPICTCENMTNTARAVAFLNGFQLSVDAAKPKANYAAVLGIPDTEAAIQATDGVQMTDVLDYQDQHGFDIGPQKLVARYGTIQINRTALALALNRLGALWVGVTLHERDMENFAAGRRWDVVDGRDDGDVVGGHAPFAWAYKGLGDNSLAQLGTWAKWQGATWAWIDARMNEAWGLVWHQLARTDGFYNGLTANGLVAEL
jgi:hypothetical protein